jgi:large subunit ribosomal protein L24
MLRLKVGDLVQVITGKEKGKQGQVTRIIPDDDRVVIEGINVITRHQKPNPRNPQGGKITREASIHASNVMLVDPETKKPTRVKFKVEDGTKKRVAKSGSEITSG